MGDVITLSWTEVLSIGGFISLVMGGLANYMRMTTMHALNRVLDERLKGYTPRAELDLHLKNIELLARQERND